MIWETFALLNGLAVIICTVWLYNKTDFFDFGLDREWVFFKAFMLTILIPVFVISGPIGSFFAFSIGCWYLVFLSKKYKISMLNKE